MSQPALGNVDPLNDINRHFNERIGVPGMQPVDIREETTGRKLIVKFVTKSHKSNVAFQIYNSIVVIRL